MAEMSSTSGPIVPESTGNAVVSPVAGLLRSNFLTLIRGDPCRRRSAAGAAGVADLHGRCTESRHADGTARPDFRPQRSRVACAPEWRGWILKRAQRAPACPAYFLRNLSPRPAVS